MQIPFAKRRFYIFSAYIGDKNWQRKQWNPHVFDHGGLFIELE